MSDHSPALSPALTPTTEKAIDFGRLMKARAAWEHEQTIVPEDIPWLLGIAESLRYLRVTQEDVKLLHEIAERENEEPVDFRIAVSPEEAERLRSIASRISSLLPPPQSQP